MVYPRRSLWTLLHKQEREYSTPVHSHGTFIIPNLVVRAEFPFSLFLSYTVFSTGDQAQETLCRHPEHSASYLGGKTPAAAIPASLPELDPPWTGGVRVLEYEGSRIPCGREVI